MKLKTPVRRPQPRSPHRTNYEVVDVAPGKDFVALTIESHITKNEDDWYTEILTKLPPRLAVRLAEMLLTAVSNVEGDAEEDPNG